MGDMAEAVGDEEVYLEASYNLMGTLGVVRWVEAGATPMELWCLSDWLGPRGPRGRATMFLQMHRQPNPMQNRLRNWAQLTPPMLAASCQSNEVGASPGSSPRWDCQQLLQAARLLSLSLSSV